MLRYSELSSPQQALFRKMKEGHVLTRHGSNEFYLDGKHIRGGETPLSMYKRGFIVICDRSPEGVETFCINVEVI